MDTASEKNILHNTVDIYFIPQVEDSDNYVFQDITEAITSQKTLNDSYHQAQSEIDWKNTDKTGRKKRRRKFEGITPDLQPFPKQRKLSETLLSTSNERRSISVTSLQKEKTINVLWMLSYALKILIHQDRRYVISLQSTSHQQLKTLFFKHWSKPKKFPMR